jgi:hypothetical protein
MCFNIEIQNSSIVYTDIFKWLEHKFLSKFSGVPLGEMPMLLPVCAVATAVKAMCRYWSNLNPHSHSFLFNYMSKL